ncbi:MAG: efflux RND transporter permease subunit, partial [Actinomycetia bacterium]|nr:efflux RND transporter permease subunit [Actinomycetes bacterium]
SGQAEAIAATLEASQVSGIEWELTGQNAEMERSSSSLKMALGLAIFLVYVSMASTFESILHPFVILFSVPLALVGVVGTLWVTGVPVSVVVFIGAIVLAGVVVNNAIVLIDYTNKLRERGYQLRDAVITAGATRLRPVLLTAITTILGLISMVTGVSFDFHTFTMSWVSESSQWWRSMAVVV